MNRLQFQGLWSQPREEELGAMEVQVWDFHGLLVDNLTGRPLYATREKLIKQAVRRAIDLADAMQTVVCIDVEGGSVIVNPGDDFESVLGVYFELRKKVRKR